MKKIVRKITTEEFENGELVKRTIEEIMEEPDKENAVPISYLPSVRTVWSEPSEEYIKRVSEIFS